jgi:peptidoglycan hydrolase-like protein with peptidoglycan-binding domain
MPDFWNVSRDVHPGMRAVSPDVMLVQALLMGHFMSPAGPRPDLKNRAATITSSSGKRFDDGIYGPNTRLVMALFEEDMRAPVKDGIVRAASVHNVLKGPETKLKKLNTSWNLMMLGELGGTKKETGRGALQPVLFRELYPSG